MVRIPPSLDSRERPLPPYLEEAPEGPRWRRSGRPVRLRVVARAGRVLMGIAVATTAIGFASLAAAIALDISGDEDTGSLFRLIGFYCIIPVVVVSIPAGRLLRLARRLDPATPPARTPGPNVELPNVIQIDFGENGPRFPGIAAPALALPLGAAAWLSPMLGYVGSPYTDPALLGIGLLVAVVPLAAGIAWWPWLRAALGGGLTPRRLTAVGWTYIAAGTLGGLGGGGVVGITAFAEGAGNALPATLGVIGLGGFLVWPGVRLIRLARSLPRP